jgi:hypothetical protein
MNQKVNNILKKSNFLTLVLIAMIGITACEDNSTVNVVKEKVAFQEQHRPQFHFSPKEK